jgi:hypothetical protein
MDTMEQKKSALEEVKRTIARREANILKGQVGDGAIANPVYRMDIMEEVRALSSIKKMDSSMISKVKQSGTVNIVGLNTTDSVGIVSKSNTVMKGTEKSPKELVPGIAKKSNANDVWYEFTSCGEIDISFVSDSSCTIIIYKKKFFGKEKVKHIKDKKIYNGELSLYNNSTYLIHIISNETYFINPGDPIPQAEISCEYKYHQDIKYSSLGGIWEVNSNSASPSSSLIYLRRYYITKLEAQKFFDTIEEDETLQFQNVAIDYFKRMAVVILTDGASPEKLLKKYFHMSSLGAAFLSEFLPDILKLDFDLIKIAEKEMKKSGNYSDGRWENGVQVDFSMYNGVSLQKYYPWKESKMLGVEGYKGHWESF